jgi:hypothetical protein
MSLFNIRTLSTWKHCGSHPWLAKIPLPVIWSTLGAQGLWSGRDLYRATPVVTRDLGFFRSLSKGSPHLVASHDMQRDAEGGITLARILIQSLLMIRKGMLRIYSNLDPHGSPFGCLLRHARGCWGPILARMLMGHIQRINRGISHFKSNKYICNISFHKIFFN